MGIHHGGRRFESCRPLENRRPQKKSLHWPNSGGSNHTKVHSQEPCKKPLSAMDYHHSPPEFPVPEVSASCGSCRFRGAGLTDEDPTELTMTAPPEEVDGEAGYDLYQFGALLARKVRDRWQARSEVTASVFELQTRQRITVPEPTVREWMRDGVVRPVVLTSDRALRYARTAHRRQMPWPKALRRIHALDRRPGREAYTCSSEEASPVASSSPSVASEAVATDHRPSTNTNPQS